MLEYSNTRSYMYAVQVHFWEELVFQANSKTVRRKNAEHSCTPFEEGLFTCARLSSFLQVASASPSPLILSALHAQLPFEYAVRAGLPTSSSTTAPTCDIFVPWRPQKIVLADCCRRVKGIFEGFSWKYHLKFLTISHSAEPFQCMNRVCMIEHRGLDISQFLRIFRDRKTFRDIEIFCGDHKFGSKIIKRIFKISRKLRYMRAILICFS